MARGESEEKLYALAIDALIALHRFPVDDVTPEGVIAAAALKGLGGEIQGVLHARNPEERAAAEALGYDFNRVLFTDDLVASDNCFFSATAITDGDFLRGVRFTEFGATTQSLVVRSRSGTVRTIETFHRHDKLQEFTTGL